MGISLYEQDKYVEARTFFNKALEFDETKISAEGWLKYIEDLSA